MPVDTDAPSHETRHSQPEARSRMISFRLTAEEYERFRTLCAARGLPNVSEMVRSAVHQLISQHDSSVPSALSAPLALRVSQLITRVDSLESRLHNLEAVAANATSSASASPDMHQLQSGLATVAQNAGG